MRILIADYSGHPFQVQLSRALAGLGHEVLHLFSSSSETPKGDLERKPSDPENFRVLGLSLSEPVDKRNFFKRRRQEAQIGRQFAAVIRDYAPDVGIFANQPIDTLAKTIPALREVGGRLVFWLQDLLGEGSTRVLSAKFGYLGAFIGRHYAGREARFLREADHIVAISADFQPILDRLDIARERTSVIENWAPIADLPMFDRDNAWAKSNLPDSKFRIIYSGTLGFKQDPGVLLDVAATIDCEILIFSEGAAARSIASQAAARGLANVVVRDWLAFVDLPKALAGADALVVLLEGDAGLFSVPSKVLTYMCVGRPIIGSIGSDNLAAKIIADSGAGIVCAPGDRAAFIEAARIFSANGKSARDAGAAARRYAEQTFNIDAIAARFQGIIRQTCDVRSDSPR